MSFIFVFSVSELVLDYHFDAEYTSLVHEMSLFFTHLKSFAKSAALLEHLQHEISFICVLSWTKELLRTVTHGLFNFLVRFGCKN